MTTKQEFLRETIDGRPYVSFLEWLKTLPESEFNEFSQAKERQSVYREEAIATGDLSIDPSGAYIWKDKQTALKGKKTDSVWFEYFTRWRLECGIADNSVFIDME